MPWISCSVDVNSGGMITDSNGDLSGYNKNLRNLPDESISDHSILPLLFQFINLYKYIPQSLLYLNLKQNLLKSLVLQKLR